MARLRLGLEDVVVILWSWVLPEGIEVDTNDPV
jgi:hypothetical protein